MDRRHPGIRKAAILVQTLDRAGADALLSQLSPEDAKLVREIAVTSGEFPADERDQVLAEFFRLGPKSAKEPAAAVELDPSLIEKIAAQSALAPRPDPEHEPDNSLRSSRPFRFLHQADIRLLVPRLKDEHPQMIAVVLSHLPHDQAARVLTSLPPTCQADVVRRLVNLDEMDPEILQEIEHGLQSWMFDPPQRCEPPKAGLLAVSGILRAADPRSKQILMASLRQFDGPLAEKLAGDSGAAPRAQRLSFEDLAELDDAALTTILRQAEPELVVLALAGASDRNTERILRPLPPQVADALRRQLDHLGPTRLSDVEAAQQELAALAEQLIGRKPSAARRGLSVAA